MGEVVRKLSAVHGWSASVPNLSDKLKRGTLRCSEAIELADVLGYDIIWRKRGEAMKVKISDIKVNPGWRAAGPTH